MIPVQVKVKGGQLPDEPGVYFYYDVLGKLLYIGKATSLKRRVGSYFVKAHDARIAELVSKIARIEYVVVGNVLEALVLEANQIRTHQPYYNVIQKDDKSFIYLCITNERYPRPVLVRGLELERMGIRPFARTLSPQAKKHYVRIFGPYLSAKTLQTALDLLREAIPWSTCQPGQKRPCFYAQIGKCPGVCTGAISVREYRKYMRELVLFFSGKSAVLVRKLRKEMQEAARAHAFEKAASLRNRLFALEHIRDVALIRKEDVLPEYMPAESGIDLDGRIEAYDISNISGTSAVGSMVVFEHGKPAKDKYRKFKIKTVKGANDVAMMEEVIRRRLRNSWELPQVMVIDGGEAQVGKVGKVLKVGKVGMVPKIVGIAKGFDRKQDRLVYDHHDIELARIAERGKELFQRARDEAHRFAVSYHRRLRKKASLGI